MKIEHRYIIELTRTVFSKEKLSMMIKKWTEPSFSKICDKIPWPCVTPLMRERINVFTNIIVSLPIAIFLTDTRPTMY